MNRKNIIILGLIVVIFAGIIMSYIGLGTAKSSLGENNNGNVDKITIKYLSTFF